MSIFNVTFSNVWQQLVPPILRKPIENAWGTSLTQPLQYNNDLFLQYLTGSTYSSFNTGTTYSGTNRVIYIDRSVYENLTGSTGPSPSDINNWMLINSNYIGARERSLYSAIKLNYETALNRWFEVNGFYPSIPASSALTSSAFAASANTIYIETLTGSTPGFLMGISGPNSSDMPYNGALATRFMVYNYSAGTSYDYTIWVPNYIYSGISESIVRNFADTINLGGMNYSVSGY